ncbi:MAG: zinc ribbon domain-containing protein [Ignavibacteria bacterium]|nr:zinc ribbon domain-containing protein [Ignavibacteria bacterium]
MPTYDYKCIKCGNTFELFHGINERPQVTCQKCGSIAQKQISLHSGLIFKGSGFYITDYKKSNSSSSTSSTKSSSETSKTENK